MTPSIIAERYSKPADRSAGTKALKSHRESTICLNHSVGKNALWVGIDSAASALLNKGFQVYAVDSSQTQLDTCFRLLGDSKISEPAPATDTHYDNVIALNVLTHFACWKSRLQDWANRVKENGRIIFNTHSLDHIQWLLKKPVTQASLPCNDASDYKSHLAIRDILDTADNLGLSVVSVIPYAAFQDDYADMPAYPDTLGRYYWWQQLLSWVIYDPLLFNMATLFEQEVISQLSPIATSQYMVVLEKRRDSESIRLWHENNQRITQALTSGGMHNSITIDSPDFGDKLSKLLLDGPRNLRYLSALNQGFYEIGLKLEIDHILTQPGQRIFRDIESKININQRAIEMTEGWHQMPEINDLLTIDRVSFGSITHYMLVKIALYSILKSVPRIST